MAAYAALVSLLNNIQAITNHPTLSTSLDDLPIQTLLEKTNFLLDFIEGNNYGAGSKEAQDLERKIASAAHAAEDLIETRIVDQIQASAHPIDAAEDMTESGVEEESHAGDAGDAEDVTESGEESHDGEGEDVTESDEDVTESELDEESHDDGEGEDVTESDEDVTESELDEESHAGEGEDVLESELESELEEDSHAGEGLHISDRSEKSLDQIQAAADPIDAAEEGGASLTWSYLLTFLLQCVGCHLSDGSEKPVDLQQINADMDAIMQEAKQLKAENRLGEEKRPTHPERPLPDSGESAMVGLDVELNQLLDELTGNQSSRRIISLVGMGGAGKTTLAKNVYENSLIKEKFQFRAWAAISQQNNPKEVLKELLTCLGEFSTRTADDLGLKLRKTEFSSGTVDDLGQRLRKTLFVKRYLIVLDDIWSVTDWDEVKHFFPDSNNGSRILITTRLCNVAEDCGSSGSSLVNMNFLDKKSSWKLFCQKTFQGEECPTELWEVGEEIVASCRGLALSIVVIGGILLKSPRTLGYWKGVAKDLKSITNSKEKQRSLDVLSLSYNHLPPHLKPCFLYMGVFREDYQIRVSKIIQLWIAEGFIKSIESQVLEEIAEGYVNDLIDRNLVLVGERRKSGKVGFCGIHDLLRDLCIKLAEQQELFHWSEGEIRGTERRLVYNTRERGITLRLPLIRSVISRSDINGITECRLLRVLDEDGNDSSIKYYRNVNLRYLSHSHRDLSYWKLPTSVSCIWNLQTLIIIKEFSDTIVVPSEFWKMRQLRHVDCDEIYITNPPPSNGQEGLLILENLQTLKSIVNLSLSEEVCKIISSIKKLYLDYDTRAHGYDDSLVESLCNLDRLHKLESLRISTEVVGDLVLYREELIISFPRSLKKLSLWSCGLDWDDMEIIGLLPRLEVLYLNSYCEEVRWSPVDGQFRQLKYLEIELCELKCWEAEASHFPVLEKLILTSLDDLEEIPLSIGDIPTLQLIRMHSCSISATISAIKIKEDQLENDGQLQLQVEVRIYDWNVESFKQKLETEELTTNNIQLKIC